jgi:hypothetical protein
MDAGQPLMIQHEGLNDFVLVGAAGFGNCFGVEPHRVILRFSEARRVIGIAETTEIFLQEFFVVVDRLSPRTSLEDDDDATACRPDRRDRHEIGSAPRRGDRQTEMSSDCHHL